MPIRQYPSSIVEKLAKKLPLFINGSNPLKLSIFNKKITILRKDLLKEMRRNSLIKIEEGDMPDHIINTVISQSHLMPISVYSQPILWNYDYAFRTFTLPDILILADGLGTEYERQQHKTQVVNPGNFYKDGSFFSIRPLKNEITMHKI